MEPAPSTRDAEASHRHRHDPADGVTLGALLEAEQELSALVERADEEGRTIVALAGERARAIEDAAATALRDELAELGRQADAAAARAVEELLDVARAEARRFDAVPDETVARLAEAVVRDFLGLEPLHPPGPAP